MHTHTSFTDISTGTCTHTQMCACTQTWGRHREVTQTPRRTKKQKEAERKGRDSKTKPGHPCSGAVGDTPRSEPPSDLPFDGTLGKLGLLSPFLLLQKKANHPDLRAVLSDSVMRFCSCLPVCWLGTGGGGSGPSHSRGRGQEQVLGSEGYSRIAEEQEVQEGVGPEEVNEGAAQTPACCRENGETGEEQQDGAKEGDLPPLRSLGQGR